ncbi:hypothetical protein [Helicobacter felis]|uniref:hypothetical protein n=1 Tax=Helicobacter felis TaxID=214 RepID=UPI000CF0A9CB|nr:hypothetical protein [Helicobacter felis]
MAEKGSKEWIEQYNKEVDAYNAQHKSRWNAEKIKNICVCVLAHLPVEPFTGGMMLGGVMRSICVRISYLLPIRFSHLKLPLVIAI